MFEVKLTRFDKLMGSNLVRPGVVLFDFPNSPYKIVAPTRLFLNEEPDNIPDSCVYVPFEGFNPTKEHSVDGKQPVPFVDLSMMQAIHKQHIGRTVGHVTEVDAQAITEKLVTYLQG